MLDISTMKDLPTAIAPADVEAEAAKYPRALVLLEDLGGWAVYAAIDGKQRTTHRRNWIAALLDLAALPPMVT
jgi:hypothetical protein